MANLAIKGHPTRGKEVIEILEMLGGYFNKSFCGSNDNLYYYIGTNGFICGGEIKYEELTCKYIIYTLEEFLEKYPYKLEQFVHIPEYDSKVCICKMRWNSSYNYMEYLVYRQDDIPEWYTAKVLLEYNTDTLIDKEGEKKSLLSQLIEYFRTTPKDELEREWNEHNEFDKIGPTVEEYVAFVESIKKQSKYPKTYEECCKILGYKQLIIPENILAYNKILLGAFHKLLVCRDAYYVIAGEQMGLDKPWKPDWTDNYRKWTINFYQGEINLTNGPNVHFILAFPTEEMRNTFYENFKDLIESCKDLL